MFHSLQLLLQVFFTCQNSKGHLSLRWLGFGFSSLLYCALTWGSLLLGSVAPNSSTSTRFLFNFHQRVHSECPVVTQCRHSSELLAPSQVSGCCWRDHRPTGNLVSKCLVGIHFGCQSLAQLLGCSTRAPRS
jgi:hypothetical protein